MLQKIRRLIEDKKPVKVGIRRYMFVLRTNDLRECMRDGTPLEYFVAGALDDVMFSIADVEEVSELNGVQCIFLKA